MKLRWNISSTIGNKTGTNHRGWLDDSEVPGRYVTDWEQTFLGSASLKGHHFWDSDGRKGKRRQDSCDLSLWKFDALWEHPLGKGEATCHPSWYSQKIGREHSTCCRRNLCIVTNLYHNILLVFGLIILWHPEMSLISVDLIVVYWSVLFSPSCIYFAGKHLEADGNNEL